MPIFEPVRERVEILPMVFFITHPDVVIDPGMPVPDWPLNKRGRARMSAMIAQPWVRGVRRVFASGERQTFTGFLFDSSGFQPNDVVPSGFAMAGTVTATMEDPDRPAFGWFALGDLVIG